MPRAGFGSGVEIFSLNREEGPDILLVYFRGQGLRGKPKNLPEKQMSLHNLFQLRRRDFAMERRFLSSYWTRPTPLVTPPRAVATMLQPRAILLLVAAVSLRATSNYIPETPQAP
jgi:hypothetical protein